jgi:hypothetical protein
MTAVSCAWAAGPLAELLPPEPAVEPVRGAAIEDSDPKHTIPDAKTARERRGSLIPCPFRSGCTLIEFERNL